MPDGVIELGHEVQVAVWSSFSPLNRSRFLEKRVHSNAASAGQLP